MKLQEQCLPCIVNQAIKTADLVGMKDKSRLLKRVFSTLAEADLSAVSSPELIGQIFALIKEEIGDPDPYKPVRDKYNRLFLSRLPEYERQIDAAPDPFREAVKYAIIGNVIDFNPIHSLTQADVDALFERLRQEELWFDHSDQLLRDLKTARTLLYLGDNCGEICLDLLLIRRIRAMAPDCKVIFAVRGAPVVNDSIEADAYFVGMDKVATILSNGDSSLGTVLHRTSPAFREAWNNADIVIAKGQANWECLSEEAHNIYFLMMTKCAVIARDAGAPEMKMLLLHPPLLHPPLLHPSLLHPPK